VASPFATGGLIGSSPIVASFGEMIWINALIFGCKHSKLCANLNPLKRPTPRVSNVALRRLMEKMPLYG